MTGACIHVPKEKGRGDPGTGYPDPRVKSEDSDSVALALLSLTNGKSPGPDKIPHEGLKFLGDVGVQFVKRLMDLFFAHGVPSALLEARTVMLYKGKGDPVLSRSYRPISLMNSLAKVIAKLLLLRIGEEVHIAPTQHGFMPNRSTATQSLLFKVVLETRAACRYDNARYTFVLFIDFVGAYDNVDRVKLLKRLTEEGVREDTLAVCSQMLQPSRSTLLLNGNEVGCVTMNRGVKQGSPVSPLQFNAFVNDMSRIYTDRSLDPGWGDPRRGYPDPKKETKKRKERGYLLET